MTCPLNLLTGIASPELLQPNPQELEPAVSVAEKASGDDAEQQRQRQLAEENERKYGLPPLGRGHMNF